MQVEITIKVDGQPVKTCVQEAMGTLAQMEETIHALGKRVAHEALQTCVESMVGPRPLFSKEGGWLRHRGYKPRTLMGLDGPITIRRARFQCEKTGDMVVPLDELLDLPPGESTPSLAQRSQRLGTRMSFAELQEEMLAQHDVKLTDSALDEQMQAVGGVAETDWQTRVSELALLPRGVEREQQVTVQRPVPQRLYISCDGITYRTCYREDDPEHPKEKRMIFQEMKVGAVYWQDEKERWHKQVVTGREEPEGFGLRLWALAVQCGMLDCPEVIFISDGGIWCSSVADLYFKGATRILDWYHLSEYIWDAGRELHPGNPKETKRWVATCLKLLRRRGGSSLQAHLDAYRATCGQQRTDALDKLISYLRPRHGITDYPTYRNKGWVIGSGMIESSCKQVVGQRLKGAGMQWSEEGALAMAALVCHRINGTWKQFWDSRPLQRAA
jgi:hypothetical protein